MKWKVSRNNDSFLFEDENDKIIGEMRVDPASVNYKKAPSHARLMAASPELLNALKLALSWLEDGVMVPWHPDRKLIEDAIIKAEGKL